jgi:GNAT superfamily N-acetyltransferase
LSTRDVTQIAPFRPDRLAACAEILGLLPDWFGIPESNARYLADLSQLPAFVALHGDRVVGFASLRVHYERSAEIEVMAVRPELHRSGVGRALLRHCEAWLRERDFSVLHVKTLAPSHPDSFYARTRAFYRALGFEPVFETPLLWGPENPALVSVKLLA